MNRIFKTIVSCGIGIIVTISTNQSIFNQNFNTYAISWYNYEPIYQKYYNIENDMGELSFDIKIYSQAMEGLEDVESSAQILYVNITSFNGYNNKKGYPITEEYSIPALTYNCKQLKFIGSNDYSHTANLSFQKKDDLISINVGRNYHTDCTIGNFYFYILPQDTNKTIKLLFGDSDEEICLNDLIEISNNINFDDINFGDVNSDGIIDPSDASYILSYYAYLSTGGNSNTSISEYIKQNQIS